MCVMRLGLQRPPHAAMRLLLLLMWALSPAVTLTHPPTRRLGGGGGGVLAGPSWNPARRSHDPEPSVRGQGLHSFLCPVSPHWLIFQR